MNKKIFISLLLVLAALIGYLLYLWLADKVGAGQEISWGAENRRKIVLVSPGGIYAPITDNFKAGLAQRGWQENGNAVFLDLTYAGRGESWSNTLAGLAAQKPDLIFAVTAPAVLAVQDLLPELPVIFAAVGDPVAAGLIKDYSHSSARAAGCADWTDNLAAKRLEIAHEAFPSLRRVVVIWDAADKNSRVVASRLSGVAAALDLEFFSVPAAGQTEYLLAAAGLSAADYDLVFLLPDELTILHWPQLAQKAQEAGLPVIGYVSGQAEKYASLTYGAAAADLGRQCAPLAEKILLGEPISESPSTIPEKLYLTINLLAVKSANLTVSPAVRLRADKIFE